MINLYNICIIDIIKPVNFSDRVQNYNKKSCVAFGTGKNIAYSHISLYKLSLQSVKTDVKIKYNYSG